MNIAIFTDTYLPQINGVVTSTLTFAQEFERQGHKIYIFAPKVDKNQSSSKQIMRFRSVVFPGQPEYQICLPWSRKLKDFKDLNIDIIHAQTPFSMGFLAQRMAKKHNLPLVHTYHTFFAKYVHYVPLIPNKIMEKYAHYESQRFCNKCQYLVVPSNQMKDKLLEYKVGSPIEVIPTGINISNLPEIENSHYLRQRYGISDHEKMLIFVGRLGHEKNVYFLLNSFQEILKTVANSRLFIAGDGPQRTNMESVVKKMGIQNQVIFTGYLNRSEIFSAYNAAQLCLFPSITETQGLTVLESLATSTPVICINAMGVKDILINNKGGFLTENNLMDFSQKAIRLLTDEKLYNEKCAEAKEAARAFSAENLARKMVDIYEESIKLKRDEV